MNHLSTEATILAELFDRDADAIPSLVARAGLKLNWTLNERDSHSAKTRKREYWNRINKAVNELEPEAERKFEDNLGRLLRNANSAGPVSPELDDLLPICRRKQYDSDLNALESTVNLLSVIMVDVDNFKQINDEFGHQAGDEALVTCAAIIKNAVVNKGNAYRYGGDEIIILLPNYSLCEAIGLAERIRREISRAEVSNHKSLTATLGVACLPESTTSFSEVTGIADKALYQAKKLGKNRVCSFSVEREAEISKFEAEPAQVQNRIDAVDIEAKIEQGTSQCFLINIENKSSEEVQITKIKIECDELKIAEAPPPAKAEHWKISANSRKQISWNASPNPSHRLMQIKKVWDKDFEAIVHFKIQAKILGKLKTFECKRQVQVQWGGNRIWDID